MITRYNKTQLQTQLRTVPFFQVLDEVMLSRLADECRWHVYESGETVFWEGETAVGLYFVQAGWLKVIKSGVSGREQVLRFLGPGETFNEVSVLANQPNPATAVALEEVGIWLIPHTSLVRLFTEQPAFAQHLIQQLAKRVIHLVTLVADLSLRSVTGRLASLLVTDTTEDVLHRPRWYTQSELASRLGTVPDVVQRALRSLTDEGVIQVERHRIQILDRDKLIEIASQ